MSSKPHSGFNVQDSGNPTTFLGITLPNFSLSGTKDTQYRAAQSYTTTTQNTTTSTPTTAYSNQKGMTLIFFVFGVY